MKTVIKLSQFKKLNYLIGVLTGCCLFAQNIFSQEKPRALAADNRIKVVAYQKNNVVPIDASTFITTQIAFSQNEIIENIQNGDLDAWSVSVQKGLPNMLFLKPTIAGSNTNMTVVTNRHTYYFQLKSEAHAQLNHQNTFSIHFIYPLETRAKMQTQLRYNTNQKHAILNARRHPQNYNWDYSFSGARSIMPLHIFDDGFFTYMQLQSGQPIPAIFTVDNAKGSESVVNYRRHGQYIIVQQIAPQFTLREGNQYVASIFNNHLIHQLRNQREK